jgi:signal transduction histidine kinase
MTMAIRVEPESRHPEPDPFSTREAMLSWVRDIAPYGILTTDSDLVIRDWNQWLVTHSGLAREAVIGRPLLTVFPEIAERGLDEHFARALRGEVAVLSTSLHRHLLPLPSASRDYPIGHMLQTARIAPLPAGDQIVGTVTIIEDVTQRECQAMILRRQQEYDRLLSETLASLLRADDPLSTIADIFPRIAAALKLDVYFAFLSSPDNTELRLHGAGGVTPEVRRTLARIPMDATLCGQVATRRSPVTVADAHLSQEPAHDHLRRLGLHSYTGFPLMIGDRVLGTLSFGSYVRNAVTPEETEFLGKLSQYAAIALDRVQRERALHEAQARLSQHATDLERTVAERTAKLHETIVQLESFSYTVAHDLRAPIRSLTGFTDILLADYADTLPETASDMLRRLQRASRRLDALTRDLLKFSRIIRDDVTLAPINIDELIADTVAVTPALQGGVLTVVAPLGAVLAQHTLLQQSLSNLFDNALKFARPGIAPRIVVRSEVRDFPAPHSASAAVMPPFQPAAVGARAAAAPGPRIRVWVEDNGIGIPPAAHQKIWGVFERIPGPRNVEGTGIGLAIVARAVQQMGGAFGVESQVGHGSRFWIEFVAA